MRLFSVVIIFYVLSGIYALTKTRKKLGIKQYIFMQTWNIVIICFLELYYLPKKMHPGRGVYHHCALFAYTRDFVTIPGIAVAT